MKQENIDRLESIKEEYEELVDGMVAIGLDDSEATLVKERLSFIRAKNAEIIRMVGENDFDPAKSEYEELMDEMEEAVEDLKEVHEDAS